MSHNPAIQALLEQAIAAEGPLLFDRFMDVALYDSQHGYYAQRNRTIVGRDGDFFTSVSTGPVFGRIWAGYFRKALANLSAAGVSAPIILEFGGHRGQLRQDVLDAAPELDYRMVDLGDPLPDRFAGVVFSNEFIDALPFRRLRQRAGAWHEILVGRDADGSLAEIEVAAQKPLPAWLDNATHPDAEMEIECRPRAVEWFRDIAQRLSAGLIVTVDYGGSREEFASKPRPRGTLRCYHRHQQGQDPLEHLGEQDITADVDFTELIEAGETAGFETVLFADQGHALLDIGREVIEEIVVRNAGQFSRERNAIHQLIHPANMGRRFKVLIQRRIP